MSVTAARTVAEPVTEPSVLRWSARNETEFEYQREALAARIAADAPEEFAGIVAAWDELERGDGEFRGALVALDRADALARIGSVKPRRTRHRPVALLFPGQGSQYVRMGAGLYGWEPTFTAAMDEFFGLAGGLGSAGGLGDVTALRSDWLSAEPAVSIHEVRRAQPLLVAVGHAMARTVIGWGVRPSALLGHSAGEIVGAVVAGVFSLGDAVAALAHRVDAVGSQPAGGMLGVAAEVERLMPFLTANVVVGAVNSPRQTVLAGPAGELAEVAGQLRAAGIMNVQVPSPVGFHSPAMNDLARQSLPVFDGMRLGPPRIPLYSAYLGAPLTAAAARDPWFWARQVADPVWFWPTLDRMLDDSDFLLVEAGPGEGLSTSASRHPAVVKARSAVVAALPARPGPPVGDRRSLLTAAARIWAEGHDIALS
jgi:acyl transferase domain-containing protein